QLTWTSPPAPPAPISLGLLTPPPQEPSPPPAPSSSPSYTPPKPHHSRQGVQKKRAVGKDSCYECKKSKVTCKRPGSNEDCERCRSRGWACAKGPVDRRRKDVAQGELDRAKYAWTCAGTAGLCWRRHLAVAPPTVENARHWALVLDSLRDNEVLERLPQLAKDAGVIVNDVGISPLPDLGVDPNPTTKAGIQKALKGYETEGKRWLVDLVREIKGATVRANLSALSGQRHISGPSFVLASKARCLFSSPQSIDIDIRSPVHRDNQKPKISFRAKAPNILSKPPQTLNPDGKARDILAPQKHSFFAVPLSFLIILVISPEPSLERAPFTVLDPSTLNRYHFASAHFSSMAREDNHLDLGGSNVGMPTAVVKAGPDTQAVPVTEQERQVVDAILSLLRQSRSVPGVPIKAEQSNSGLEPHTSPPANTHRGPDGSHAVIVLSDDEDEDLPPLKLAVVPCPRT
ncbi:hypothetical protein FALBO_5351, partial [Fusarium albosuccineum]